MPRSNHPGILLTCSHQHQQHGAALMVMLITMIVGAATLLVSSLVSSTIKNERDKTTENALTQAKEALIGYAVSDSNHPGNLPCPDVDDDGKLVMNVDYVGSNCASPIGRLPWKTLGLPELRDGAGEHLWYAVSKPFAAIGTPHINSDTQGTLSIGGTASASNVIAIVFAPGPAMGGAGRSPGINAACTTSGTTLAQSRCAANYLEGSNAASSTWTSPNLSYQSADASPTFNDRMIFITHQNLMPLVEKRIAREAITCLESYASTYFNMYPWAVPVTDITNYASQTNTLFGRLPLSVTSSPIVQQLLDDLAALQRALNAYYANSSDQTTIDALNTAGVTLNADATNANTTTAYPLDSAALQQLQNAGVSAKNPKPNTNWNLDKVTNWVSSVQQQVDQAIKFIMSENHGGITPGGWPSGCKIIPSTYWQDWRNLVFYQIATGYAPSANLPPGCGSPNTCLTINGSGNTTAGSGTYRAAIAVAGKTLSGTRTPSSITNYLEGAQANRTNPASSTLFDTYKTFDASYQAVNDLVLCVDGGNNCR